MPDRFLDAMRLLAGAVTIISAGDGESAAGLTATAVCSLSAEPPRMLACLNRAGSTFKALSETSLFCVNILACDQQDLALAFAGRTGKVGADKFLDDVWDTQPGHAPRHKQALVALRCRVHLMTLMDTHAIVIGDVIDTHFGPHRGSLIYREGGFLPA